MAIQWGPGSSTGSSQIFFAGTEVRSQSTSSAFGAIEVTTDIYLRSNHQARLSGTGSYILSGSATEIANNVAWELTFAGQHALLGTRTDVVMGMGTWHTDVAIQPTSNGRYGNGWIHVSASWSLDTPEPAAPATPLQLNVERHNDTYQDLSWSNADTEEAPYAQIQIWRNVDGGSFSLRASITPLEEYRDTTTPGHIYGYRLRAVNTSGVSDFTPTREISTTPNAPSTAPGLELLPNGDVRVFRPVEQDRPLGDLPPIVAFWQVWSRVDEDWGGAAIATLSANTTSWVFTPPGPDVCVRASYISSNPPLYSLPGPEAYLEVDSPPDPPTNLAPHGITVDVSEPVPLSWDHNSTDGSPERLSQVRYRQVSGPKTWVTIRPLEDPPELIGLEQGPAYEWQVRTWGDHDQPSGWSEAATFSTGEPLAEPVVVPITPVMIWRSPAVRFLWTYEQADGMPQEQWRIELVDSETDEVVESSIGHNTETRSWTTPEVAQEGKTYLWKLWVTPQGSPEYGPVSTSFVADFSQPPEQPTIIVGGVPLPDLTIHTIEHNHHRVSIFEKGGKHRLFDLDKTEMIRWSRELDHTGEATIVLTPPFGNCHTRLSEITAMRHEVVIYFNGKRSWEGPVTYIKDRPGEFTIKAKDVTYYLNRMVMTERHTSRLAGGARETVIDRMWRIIQREGARFELDPLPINVLPYVTMLKGDSDVKTARTTLAGEKYVFDELDDLAWKNGIDYGVAGRRIYMMDTDTGAGQVRRLTTADFMDPVEVIFYGAELATEAFVTDRQGRYVSHGPGTSPFYGRVELLHGNYAEADNPEAAAAIPISDMRSQAQRDFSPRYPLPMAVRVPQNAGLNHNTFLELYNSLFPGVRVPITAEGTVHSVSRMMKLKSLKVEELEGQVTASVTLSPATEIAEGFEDE